MDQIEQVAEFISDVVGLPCPTEPTMMQPSRVDWFACAIKEELQEFQDAATVEDQVDALVDLAYFALGRLRECGLTVGQAKACFNEVHRANMSKVRGSLAKRPGSLGYDAVKPAGWVGPDHASILARDDLYAWEPKPIDACMPATAICQSDFYVAPDGGVTDQLPSRPPKVLVLGHARHGKDTVAELLRDEYGLSFQSSSMFAAERVIMPHFALAGAPYGDVASCYEDRVNHRSTWFELIEAYNREDWARLARELFTESDVYVGLRSAREFWAVKEAGLYDLCIWVDASWRMPPEDASSCTVTRHMADVVLDNNGSVDSLRRGLKQLLSQHLPELIR